MKVAFLIHAFGGLGGTEGYSVRLAEYLARCGDALDVYCVTADPAAVEATGVTVIPLSCSGRGWWRNVAFHRSCQALRLEGYDVVQGFGRSAGHSVYRAGGGVHRNCMKAMSKIGLSGGLRSVDPREWWTVRVDDRCFRSARIAFCNSDMAAEQARVRHPGVDVRMIRNGVDSVRFAPSSANRAEVRAELGVPSGGRVVLFPGSGYRRKGLETALAAFQQVCAPSDRFVVMGRDRRISRYRGHIEQQLGARAVCIGAQDNPERWMAAADATVLPTRYDSAANTTLESLACGVPTVTSRADGSAEVVPDPRWTVGNPERVDEVAEALEHALAAGSEGRERARAAVAPHTWDRNGDAVRAVYGEVALG